MTEWFKDSGNVKALGWGLRYARLVSETPTREVLETLILWDSDVIYSLQQFVSRFAARDRHAQDLLGLPRARAADLNHLSWWRKAIVKQFDFDAPDESTSAKLITEKALGA